MSTTEQTRPQTVEPLRHARMLIGGAWVDSASGAMLSVENPGRRQAIADIPRGGAADVDRAVQAAAQAFPAWSKVPPRDRGRLLLRVAEALEARGEELSRTIALETGNALRTQARSEARLSADIFRYFGGLAGELKGETIPLGEHVLSYTRREPIGVVGAIIPWNAPVLLGALKIAPALCAGNTLVLKAAEDAPLGVLLMAEVCQEFLPPGVLNVLTGLGEECGAALAQHPAIRKLSFTGSTEVGKMIMRAAADRIVPVSLELGGKSPCDRVSGCGRGLGGGRRDRGHALHPPEPILHRRFAPVPARRHLRQLPRQVAHQDPGAEARRSAGRGNRYRRASSMTGSSARCAATSTKASGARMRDWCSAGCRRRTGR